MDDIVIADLHLTDKQQDEYRWHSLLNLHRTITRPQAIGRIIVLGDITENKDRHSEELVNRIVALFILWCNQFRNANVIILAGNHCGITSQRAFFRFLIHFDRIQYITEPINVDGELFLPHTRNEHDWDSYRPFDSRYKTIYMHQTVRGATAANSQTLDGMDANIFEDRKVPVYSGDVHTRQTIEGHIHYIGAPYPINFGDADGGTFLFISGGSQSFINLPHPIKKKKIRITHTNPIRHLTEQENFRYQDSQFSIVVSIPQTELVHWPKIKKTIQEYITEKGSVCVRVQAEVIKARDVDRRRRSTLAMSSSDVVKRFADQNKLGPYYLKIALNTVEEER